MSAKITRYAQFLGTGQAFPLCVRIITEIFKLIFVQARAVEVKPVRAKITANTVNIFRKDFVTRNTVFFNTRVTSPGFIWIFFVQFYAVIR